MIRTRRRSDPRHGPEPRGRRLDQACRHAFVLLPARRDVLERRRRSRSHDLGRRFSRGIAALYTLAEARQDQAVETPAAARSVSSAGSTSSVTTARWSRCRRRSDACLPLSQPLPARRARVTSLSMRSGACRRPDCSEARPGLRLEGCEVLRRGADPRPWFRATCSSSSTGRSTPLGSSISSPRREPSGTKAIRHSSRPGFDARSRVRAETRTGSLPARSSRTPKRGASRSCGSSRLEERMEADSSSAGRAS